MLSVQGCSVKGTEALDTLLMSQTVSAPVQLRSTITGVSISSNEAAILTICHIAVTIKFSHIHTNLFTQRPLFCSYTNTQTLCV